MMSELEEFYTYVEMEHVAKNPARFAGTFEGGKLSHDDLGETFMMYL